MFTDLDSQGGLLSWELREGFQEKVMPSEERWKKIPERGSNTNKAQRQEMVWLMRGATEEQSRIAMRDVTRDESDEVLGESSRSPLSQAKGLDSLLYKMGHSSHDVSYLWSAGRPHVRGSGSITRGHLRYPSPEMMQAWAGSGVVWINRKRQIQSMNS